MQDPMEMNFVGFEMQKWNIPRDRARRVYDKNGVICLVTMFTPRVMIRKMSKMVYFSYFLLVAVKNGSSYGQNIYVNVKDLIEFFQKMVWLAGFGMVSRLSIYRPWYWEYKYKKTAEARKKIPKYCDISEVNNS